jgi:MFS transporter, DHA3 family, macrolide efflux protein
MRGILRQRSLRLLFTGNFVSMLGSGMNSAALSWYVLQKTHSEISLGTLILLQTLPMLLLAPLSGVVADRMDRRRLVMMMDGVRALVIFLVAVICLFHKATLIELYGMSVVVSAATSIFWPTMTALTHELTPSDQYVMANTLLMSGVQGGFLVAGAIVGFVYNRVGLGGVLLADVATYVVSLLCYGLLRSGKHVVLHPADAEPYRGIMAQFRRDTVAGIRYLQENLYIVFLCSSSAIIFAAIVAQNVVIPPLADQILHAGAVGFGWINAAWAVGAFLSGGIVPLIVRRFGVKGSVAAATGLVAVGCVVVPFCSRLAVALLIFLIMGAARGVSVVGVNTGLMEVVPQHYMGRVQNTFAMFSRLAQILIAVGLAIVARNAGLIAAFCGLAMVYLLAAAAASAAGSPPVYSKESVTQMATAETI